MTASDDPEPARRGWRDVRLVARVRVRQGLDRVRAAWFPILQASVAAGIAFGIGRYGLGHEYPFFAPICAWIALGFSADRSLRRVAEIAVGVAIGVGLGDALVHVIGTGLWQVAVVLFVAAILARLVDRGALLTTQAGVQAMVIVGLPTLAAGGGALGRWTDALVGGSVAFVMWSRGQGFRTHFGFHNPTAPGAGKPLTLTSPPRTRISRVFRCRQQGSSRQ